jgi:hypothetical protein
MTFYDIRIEPRRPMEHREIKCIIERAFAEYGGLTAEGVEILNED